MGVMSRKKQKNLPIILIRFLEGVLSQIELRTATKVY